MATPEDRVLLLLSIKEKGKRIDLGHIVEKTVRDEKGRLTEAEVEGIVGDLVSQGLISEEKRTYSITQEGMSRVTARIKEVGDELNLSYRLVLTAKNYYPLIADAMVPFLKDRATSVVKIFSDQKDPIDKVKPLFVRYARYKPKPVFIQINTAEELLRYVNVHAIDFIPYVHLLGAKEPDWFVLDLDAGPAFKDYPRGFELVKIVGDKVVEVLEDCEISSCIKFSGSRGIQIWARLDNAKLPSGDLFALYRRFATFIQGEAEKKIQELPSNILKEFYEVTQEGKAITTSVVAKKEERADQILIDWSSMKPNGDVRAPFSIHYKTGLVSCPIERKRLLDFDPREAEPENVYGEVEGLSKAFELEVSDPSLLLRGL
jgi:DNA primase